MIPRPFASTPEKVRDLELRLAEELASSAVLERDERAQEDADRLARDAADPLQVRLALVAVEVGQQRAQVGEVDEREAPLVGEAGEQGKARLLRRVRAEHLRP